MREQFGGWANENSLVLNFKSQEEQAGAEPHFPRDVLPDAWVLHNAGWMANEEVPMFPDQVII